ncbi:MAG: MauE/DoxX family redox-associated membrane protein [Pseudosphingobacterium sp.]|nr:MauE/DoxX family redox-associated membrane protein [Pseudosphingobacterium sp.]
MKKKKITLIIHIVALLYLFLFAYTAHAKLTDHENFFKSLDRFPFIPGFVAIVLAWMIPIIEAVIGIFLIIPQTRPKALKAGLALMVVFTVYLSAVVLSGLPLSCSCGGVISAMSWKEHILFNAAFIILAVIALYGKRLKEKLLAVVKRTKQRIQQRVSRFGIVINHIFKQLKIKRL